MASFWAIKNDFWLTLFEDDPNVDLNSRDQTWKWAGNVSGNYSLPLGIQLGAFIQSKIGTQGQRTNVFRAVDPDGGPRLNQLSTVTLRLDRPGAQKSPAIHVVNLRASKHFAVRGSRVQFDFDLFNLFNASAPITANFQSGPSFGYATAVVPPRIARIGFRYTF